jgi:anaerobic selenocysteine-containing dehydrogenase/Fe-S-cluster-containing dehydrogenase component
MDRRTFLELMGVGSAGALAACTGAPKQKIYAYLNPPAGVVPGVPSYYATVCRGCPAGCGIVVKTREARPIKLEGNPAHPVNQGRLCARGQAQIQGLYGRDRVQRPQLRKNGKLVDVGWDEALAAASATLARAKRWGLVTGIESGTFEDLVRDLGEKLPGLTHVRYEPWSLAAQQAASRLLFGLDEVPTVDLDEADYVLALGADFLDAWMSPVQFARQWSDAHGGPGRKQIVDYVGPRRNLTATAADTWTRLAPEKIGDFARAALVAAFMARRSTLPNEVANLVAAWVGHLAPAADPPEVAPAVQRLLAARRPIVLFGGTEVLGADAVATHAAALLTNLVTGTLGDLQRYGRGFALGKADPESRLLDLLGKSGDLDALLVYGSNPAYTLPGQARAAAKLGAAKQLVVLAHEHNETTALAHVVLPVHHPLESWGDYEVTSHVVGMMQPVRAPLHDSRHVGDLLIELAGRAGKPLAHEDYRAYVAERWSKRQIADLTDVLVMGGSFTPPPEPSAPPALSMERNAASLPQIARSQVGLTGQGATLVAPLSALLYDGRETTRDWLMEAPDSLTQSAWEIPAELATDVAQAAGVRTGDRVRLAANGKELVATALVEADLAPGTVALRFGGGRVVGRDQPDSGNVMALLGSTLDGAGGTLALVQTRVQVSRVAGGELASVSGGTDSRKRDLALRVEMRDAKAGRWPIVTRQGDAQPGTKRWQGKSLPMVADDLAHEGKRPHDNAYELAKHPEHRWGLSVDLDKCTGCGACVVACFAENNIPMVGRELVKQGREMQWIRVEKHVFPDEDKAQRVRFLPVMCQQCAQAPCETVCPVFAAYHTPDGLNGQIYNRCIGTRYCSNNCPYKARRFNYFDYEREKPANQQLNPDVTVRSRGVMEKCTFCIQRIRETTNRAKAEGRAIKDGEIQPACVQTCPSKALVFGDYKQPESQVSKLARDPRGYRLLDYQVNTRPSVVYLRKIYSGEGEG